MLDGIPAAAWAIVLKFVDPACSSLRSVLTRTRALLMAGVTYRSPKQVRTYIYITRAI